MVQESMLGTERSLKHGGQPLHHSTRQSMTSALPPYFISQGIFRSCPPLVAPGGANRLDPIGATRASIKKWAEGYWWIGVAWTAAAGQVRHTCYLGKLTVTENKDEE